MAEVTAGFDQAEKALLDAVVRAAEGDDAEVAGGFVEALTALQRTRPMNEFASADACGCRHCADGKAADGAAAEPRIRVRVSDGKTVRTYDLTAEEWEATRGGALLAGLRCTSEPARTQSTSAPTGAD